ncbi:MAG: alpha-galactosidase [Actinomycetes bacterium]
MRSRLVTGLVAVALVAPAPLASALSRHGPRTFAADGVTASVTATTAQLSDGRVTRRWSLVGGVRTVSLIGPDGHELIRPTPDFVVDIDGVATSSVTGWRLIDTTAAQPPRAPGRPLSSTGAALLFRYALATGVAPAQGVELDRLVVLHPGTTTFQTSTVVLNHSALPLRIPDYRLDQVTSAAANLPAEVGTYHGGSDWRDDYRQTTHPVGAFDDEGEVARFGSDSGLFLVAQRRGGLMSRAGRDTSGTSWIGVDWARDAFDFGPLRDQPPSYNRLKNPAYPLPVRARVLRSLARLDLGTSYLGAFSGGSDEAAAEFARAFVGAAEPAFARSVDLNTFHPWSHGDGMSDPNLRPQADAAATLGIETFMLDDQWQGGHGGESGDWRFDPARFPDRNHDGVPDFVAYVHEHGLQLGLWMSPLEFNGASRTYRAHPQWACAPTGDVTARVPDDAGLGVWDATNPAFQKYLLGVIDRLVRQYGVAEFKFDFMAWVDCGSHDYADYEASFVSLVHAMQRSHPTVTFELDETNDQRSWPFESAEIGPSWFDNAHLHGSTTVAKLLHDIWTAAPWVPTWSIGMGVFDDTLAGQYAGVHGVDTLMPLALLSHPTYWTDLTKLPMAERAETAWWLRWYAANRDQLGPAVYELTTNDPLNGSGWAAWQPWNGERGYVFAFRQAGGSDTDTVRLHGVSPGVTYTVADVRTGATLGSYTGSELASGMTLTLPEFSATVLEVSPAP